MGVTAERVELTDACAAAPERRLTRLRYFSSEDYLRLNADVAQAKIDPVEHAVLQGIPERRQLFRPQRVIQSLLEASGNLVPDRIGREGAGGPPEGIVQVLVSSMGNIYMKDLAVDLARDLTSSGVRNVLNDERTGSATAPGLSVVIAPHEFFTLGQGQLWAVESFFRRTIMLNTEQIHTPWFVAGLRAMLSAAAILDLSCQSADLFREAGIPALHYEPSPTSVPTSLEADDWRNDLVRSLPEGARRPTNDQLGWDDRAVDVCFFGHESPRRDEYLARMAQVLANYRTHIYLRRQAGPLSASGAAGAASRIASHVAANSRISLNIHQGVFPYFEWHRIVRLGMARGSLVVTDPCLPHPKLLPGVHFLEEEPRHLGDLVDWLLRDDDGRELARLIVDNARRFTGNAGAHASEAARLAEFLGEVEGSISA